MSLDTELFRTGFVLFRNFADDIINLAESFGTIYQNDPAESFAVDADAKILRIANTADENGRATGLFGHHDLEWHNDFAHTPGDFHITVLKAIKNANLAATILCDTRAAFDDLPESEKVRLSALSCRHSATSQAYREEISPAMERLLRRKKYRINADYSHKYLNYQDEPPRRPVVARHPITDEQSLYLGIATNQDRFDGWDEIVAHCTQEKYCTAIEWNDGDVLVFDNILTMHRRGPFSGERELHRVQVNYERCSNAD